MLSYSKVVKIMDSSLEKGSLTRRGPWENIAVALLLGVQPRHMIESLLWGRNQSRSTNVTQRWPGQVSKRHGKLLSRLGLGPESDPIL